jgi:hypothetical protein
LWFQCDVPLAGRCAPLAFKVYFVQYSRNTAGQPDIMDLFMVSMKSKS